MALSLEKKIRDKARRPMQEGGVYDPMEQAGHRDMIAVNYVFEELGKVAQQIRSRILEYLDGDEAFADEIAGLLVEKVEGEK